MIRQRFYIAQYDWHVTAYYAITKYNIGEILYNLKCIGCDGDFMEEAYINLSENKLNSGLTYSNYFLRETVKVVAMADSAKQFHRCLIHEIRHLQSHIATTYNLNEKGEQVCYLMDDIIEQVHDTTAHLICNCCRNKH